MRQLSGEAGSVHGTVTTDRYDEFEGIVNDPPPETVEDSRAIDHDVTFPGGILGDPNALLFDGLGPVGVRHDVRVAGKVGDRFIVELRKTQTETVTCGTQTKSEQSTLILDPVKFDANGPEPDENLLFGGYIFEG